MASELPPQLSAAWRPPCFPLHASVGDGCGSQRPTTRRHADSVRFSGGRSPIAWVLPCRPLARPSTTTTLLRPILQPAIDAEQSRLETKRHRVRPRDTPTPSSRRRSAHSPQPLARSTRSRSPQPDTRHQRRQPCIRSCMRLDPRPVTAALFRPQRRCSPRRQGPPCSPRRLRRPRQAEPTALQLGTVVPPRRDLQAGLLPHHTTVASSNTGQAVRKHGERARRRRLEAVRSGKPIHPLSPSVRFATRPRAVVGLRNCGGRIPHLSIPATTPPQISLFRLAALPLIHSPTLLATVTCLPPLSLIWFTHPRLVLPGTTPFQPLRRLSLSFHSLSSPLPLPPVDLESRQLPTTSPQHHELIPRPSRPTWPCFLRTFLRLFTHQCDGHRAKSPSCASS